MRGGRTVGIKFVCSESFFGRARREAYKLARRVSGDEGI